MSHKSIVVVHAARGNINDHECDPSTFQPADYYSFLRDTGHDDMALEFDNICPLCGVAFTMGENNLEHCVHSFKELNDNRGAVLCVHRCPKCKQFFVTRHMRVGTDKALKQVAIWPEPILQHDSYIEDLKEFSPRFYELYSSAVRLENLGMTAVIGNVYRMALECIVKDYAIHVAPDDAEKVRNDLTLHVVIQTYFKDAPLVQKLAMAAKSLGNSYTHYVQKFDVSDIVNMKLFLDSVCAFVSQVLRLEELEASADKYIDK